MKNAIMKMKRVKCFTEYYLFMNEGLNPYVMSWLSISQISFNLFDNRGMHMLLDVYIDHYNQNPCSNRVLYT